MFILCIFISVTVLPVALSLIIQAPENAVSGGQSSISWVSNASDPLEFSLNLVKAASKASGSTFTHTLQTPVSLSSSPFTVDWSGIAAADGYSIAAIDISDFNDIYAQSSEFTIASPGSPSSSDDAASQSLPSPSSTSSGSSFDATTLISTQFGTSSVISPTLVIAGTTTDTPTAVDTLGIHSTSITTPITPTPSITPIVSSSKKTVLGAIVGGVIGGVVASMIVGLSLCLGLRRCRHSRGKSLEGGEFRITEDNAKLSATSDGVMLSQLEPKPITAEHAYFVSILPEQRVKSLLQDNLILPTSFGLEILAPTDNMLDSGSPVTISTAHATLGAVEHKASSGFDDILSEKTSMTLEQALPPEQSHPERLGITHREPEIVDSDLRRYSTVFPPNLPVQTREFNDRGDDLIREESVLLVEFREIVQRLEAIRSTRTRPITPPPEYASS